MEHKLAGCLVKYELLLAFTNAAAMPMEPTKMRALAAVQSLDSSPHAFLAAAGTQALVEIRVLVVKHGLLQQAAP